MKQLLSIRPSRETVMTRETDRQSQSTSGNSQRKISPWISDDVRGYLQKIKTPEGQRDIGGALPQQWQESKVIERLYVLPRISGEPNTMWLDWAVKNHVFSRDGIALSLGCGEGDLDRHVITQGLCREIEGVDIDSDALETARQKAFEAKMSTISYHQRNLNESVLMHDYYDFVYASASIHHIRNLEHLFQEVTLALKPGGVFIINEFVGPTMFQFTDLQIQIINEILRILPDRYCLNLIDPEVSGKYKKVFLRPSVEDVLAAQQPDEAIRSEEILPIMRDYFEILELKPFGGTILQMLCHKIMGNFKQDDENDILVIRLLCYLEDVLLRAEVLEHDFAVVVAKPRT